MSDQAAAATPMRVVLGGITVAVNYRDGSTEEVKVRQLPIELIDQWATLQGDEAGLVELYCDKRDLRSAQRLNILRQQELRLLQLMNTSGPDQFDSLNERIESVRDKLEELEKEDRWDSKLLPESHEEILRIGEELNSPIFDRWAQDRLAAIGRIKKTNTDLQSLLSAISPPSAASSSG